MQNNISACRRLISAILAQALTDAQSSYRGDEPDGARRFINADNELFCTYCYLIDLEPEYVARKMQETIRRKRGKKKDAMRRMQIPL